MFSCEKCEKRFTRRDNLTRHSKTTLCVNVREECGQDNHRQKKQNSTTVLPPPVPSTSYVVDPEEMDLLQVCENCGTYLSSVKSRILHENGCKKRKSQKEDPFYLLSKKYRMLQVEDEDGFVEIESAFEGRLKTYYLKNSFANTHVSNNIDQFLDTNFEKVRGKLEQVKSNFGPFKVNFLLECEYVPIISDLATAEVQNRSFKTKNIVVTISTDVSNIITESFLKIKEEYEECELKGSGLVLNSINGLLIRINKYCPLRARAYIDLPELIKRTKSVINVQNDDDYCFKYAVLAKFVAYNPQRVSNYANLEHLYDFSNLSFPVSFNDIAVFETANNVSINVFGIDEDVNVYPIKIADEEKDDHRDLLIIKKPGNDFYHYCYISNFERLVGRQYNTREHCLKICKRCFTHFDARYDNIIKFEDHKRLCVKNNPCRIVLPEENSNIYFKNYDRQYRLPFAIYVDFESVLQKIQNCENRKDGPFTNPVQLHDPISFGFYVKCDESIPLNLLTNIPLDPVIYRGPDAPKIFLTRLIEVANEIVKILTKYKNKMNLSNDEERQYKECSQCYVCGNVFTNFDKKVIDHCHITGRYRGAAHNSCNLKLKTQHFLPVFIHNLSKYDGHFIVRMLDIDDKRIEVIPNSEEVYISFSKHCNGIKLRFVDSYRLMPSSLESLTKNLQPENFRETKKFYSDPEKFHLLIKKGIFCYDYLDDPEKCNETELPQKSFFYNHLTNSHVTNEQYEHAQNVWATFKIQTLGEYMDLYLKTDVLLLADVFENFRDMCLETYKLDAAHYFTTPSIAFDAALKITGISLDLLCDYEMYAMIEQSIRGGICQSVQKHAIANNKYMKTHNPESEQVFIKYFDVTNLYGWAMCQPLPYGGFEWVEDPQSIDIGSIKDDADIGYFFDVTIDYPEVLHDCHADFPLLPVRQKPPGGKVKKLLTTLEDKDRYVLHGKNLKQALSLGLKLKTIHRALKFKQSNWLKKYVDLNTSKRNASTNDFDKANFKLMVNAFFGKSMENVRKRMCMELVNDKKRLLKLIASPKFKDRTIYSENLCAIHMNKSKIELNKPMYIGMAILDLSKTLMYDFHYNIIKPVFADRIRLLYMDTDSFIYRISSPDVYIELLPLQNHFDCSDYAIDHPFFSMDRKKIIGTMKDETAGVEITEFVGIRAKMYSFTTEDGKEVKKIKGVTKTAVSNSLSFKDFRDTVQLEKNYYVKMRIFRSIKHIIYTQDLNKLALSWHDDKRVLMPDKVSTLPHGHYSLRLLFDEDYH